MWEIWRDFYVAMREMCLVMCLNKSVGVGRDWVGFSNIYLISYNLSRLVCLDDPQQPGTAPHSGGFVFVGPRALLVAAHLLQQGRVLVVVLRPVLPEPEPPRDVQQSDQSHCWKGREKRLKISTITNHFSRDFAFY